MFNRQKFISSLEELDDSPCDLSFDEIMTFVGLAKQSDSDLEYVLSCAFCLGFKRGIIYEQCQNLRSL